MQKGWMGNEKLKNAFIEKRFQGVTQIHAKQTLVGFF